MADVTVHDLLIEGGRHVLAVKCIKLSGSPSARCGRLHGAEGRPTRHGLAVSHLTYKSCPTIENRQNAYPLFGI
jgi:hypothetical protein